MKIFLDTANIAHIKEAASWGVLSGVTTNPTLIAKEGGDFHRLVREICRIVDGEISAEVVAADYEGMVAEGEKIAKLHKNIVVKIPLTKDGLKAIKHLSSKGIKVNCTLIFSANQALLAALAGAYIVSPFVGRLDDIGHDGMQVVRDMVEIFRLHGIKTKVLAASIRHPLHVLEAAKAGAHIASMPFGVLEKMVKHPLTDKGLAAFIEDAKKGGVKI